jgi:hypothetical protein
LWVYLSGIKRGIVTQSSHVADVIVSKRQGGHDIFVDHFSVSILSHTEYKALPYTSTFHLWLHRHFHVPISTTYLAQNNLPAVLLKNSSCLLTRPLTSATQYLPRPWITPTANFSPWENTTNYLLARCSVQLHRRGSDVRIVRRRVDLSLLGYLLLGKGAPLTWFGSDRNWKGRRGRRRGRGMLL